MCLAHKNGRLWQNEIAKLLGVSPKCVSSTEKRYEETSSVSNRSSSGRPWKLTLRDENYIFREIRKDPTSSYQKLATDFNSKTQGWCNQRLNGTVNDYSRVIFRDESNFQVFNQRLSFERSCLVSAVKSLRALAWKIQLSRLGLDHGMPLVVEREHLPLTQERLITRN
ncbi:Homeodomain-like DNA binding domain-containing transcription [Brachionus plicatilis]|uniref:Homeodomain-like DNA binding domain-containing transcription n=1 Tax=Brachionus plicatilis TaxID=10195 RepID=A0A3M7RKB5_BRAPC|nr:Homeodomain-like DNA binding domain-containing transcription [Brachionus plicatilis]